MSGSGWKIGALNTKRRSDQLAGLPGQDPRVEHRVKAIMQGSAEALDQRPEDDKLHAGHYDERRQNTERRGNATGLLHGVYYRRGGEEVAR